MTEIKEEQCCPQFFPEPWQDKTFEWSDKKFIKSNVRTFFFMPLNMNSIMKKLMGAIESAGAATPESMCLYDHTSKWNMDVYAEVTGGVAGFPNLTISGDFYTKVYDGPFGDTGKWMKDYEADAQAKGFEIEKYYMWYTTCPKCSKKYGHNYTVILGKRK